MEHKKNKTTEKETTRIDAFSDGVFGIAITLLVLELIQLLHFQTSESLLKTFLHHWQSFLAFLIGFITILVCWINHHFAFEYIKKVDTNLMWINGFLLFVVTLTPFPTAVLAEYLEKEGGTALAIFGFNYFLIAIGSYWICAYSYNKSLIDENDRELFHCIKLTYGYSIIYTLVAFGVCFISIPAAIILYLMLFYVFAFPKDFALRLLKRKHKRIKRPGLNKKN